MKSRCLSDVHCKRIYLKCSAPTEIKLELNVGGIFKSSENIFIPYLPALSVRIGYLSR